MRLSEALREPAETPRGWWIAGAGVMVIVIFVALAMPWHDIGRRVLESEIPRPKLHDGRWGAEGCIDTGDYYVVSVGVHGVAGGFASITADREAAIAPDALDAWIRKQDDERSGRGALLVRAHRRAPWSSVVRILEAAARTGHEDVRLQIGGWNFLRVYLAVDASFPPDEEVIIAALPLADPEGTLEATRERAKGGRLPVVRVDPPTDADVETVLHGLECYAVDEYEGSVRLAVRP